MKKQLLIAAVAATMTSVAMADISIKGDAYVHYGDTNAAGDNGQFEQRVRLHFTGTAGDTTVKAVIRNMGNTGAGGDATASNGTYTDELYMTTKLGGLTVKAGDWYETTGFGAKAKGLGQANAVQLSTSVGGVNLEAQFAGADSGTADLNLIASGTVAGFDVTVEDQADTYTDIAVKGDVAGFGVAYEAYNADAANSDTTLIHVSKEVNGIMLDAAQLKNDTAGLTTNNKFRPLGSALLGKSNSATAIGDTGSFTKVSGVSATTDVAGNSVKVIMGTLTDLGGESDFREVLITRSMGAGVKGNLSWGSADAGTTAVSADTDSYGARIDVKF